MKLQNLQYDTCNKCAVKNEHVFCILNVLYIYIQELFCTFYIYVIHLIDLLLSKDVYSTCNIRRKYNAHNAHV